MIDEAKNEQRKEKGLVPNPAAGWMANEERKGAGYDPYPDYKDGEIGSIVKNSRSEKFSFPDYYKKYLNV